MTTLTQQHMTSKSCKPISLNIARVYVIKWPPYLSYIMHVQFVEQGPMLQRKKEFHSVVWIELINTIVSIVFLPML